MVKNVSEVPINRKVKVVFRATDSRFPQVGKFVNLGDAKYLASRNMVRFVNLNRLDLWNDETPDARLTKIYVATDFLHVLILNK